MKYLFVFLAAVTLHAKSVCLNMIVKNESRVIERCLRTVKPYIDYWVIVDTGSTDGTQEIIKNFMKDIPGELHEQPWKNFGHNRHEALKLAKGKADYVMFIDADEQMEGHFDKENLTEAVYLATLCTSKDPLMVCLRGFLIDNSLNWRWQGVIHEQLKCDVETRLYAMPEVTINAVPKDGARAQNPKKYWDDAQVLEKGLINEPDNVDYVYYLAQCYFGAAEYELALKNYQRRAKLDGWDQQTFWSIYYSGVLQQMLNYPAPDYIKSWTDSYLYRPTRAEPICRMAQYFFDKKDYILSYLLAEYALLHPLPHDIIYVEEWLYSYGMLAVLGNSAMALGKLDEAKNAYDKITKGVTVPQVAKDQAANTIRLINQHQETLR